MTVINSLPPLQPSTDDGASPTDDGASPLVFSPNNNLSSPIISPPVPFPNSITQPSETLGNIEIWAQSEIFNALIIFGFIIGFIILLYSIVSDQNPVQIVQSAARSGGEVIKTASEGALL